MDMDDEFVDLHERVLDSAERPAASGKTCATLVIYITSVAKS
jgi:hypothetical protein